MEQVKKYKALIQKIGYHEKEQKSFFIIVGKDKVLIDEIAIEEPKEPTKLSKRGTYKKVYTKRVPFYLKYQRSNCSSTSRHQRADDKRNYTMNIEGTAIQKEDDEQRVFYNSADSIFPLQKKNVDVVVFGKFRLPTFPFFNLRRAVDYLATYLITDNGYIIFTAHEVIYTKKDVM